jgi:RimJ/RimL family protein N-acetyltransferase
VAEDAKLIVELRAWSDEDLPLLERLMGDPAMTEHLGGPETPEQIRMRHVRYLHSGPPGPDRMLVVLVGQRRQPAGSIGYWERTWRGEQVWETGWSILSEFQGQGVASAATQLVIQRAWAEAKFRYMHAFPATDNAPSNAICRKAGFELLGAVDFEYPPGHVLRCNDWELDLVRLSVNCD